MFSFVGPMRQSPRDKEGQDELKKCRRHDFSRNSACLRILNILNIKLQAFKDGKTRLACSQGVPDGIVSDKNPNFG
jgi:hypothetical protein